MAEGKIRIKDIAKIAGVSATTVSNVIHGRTEKVSRKTRKRIEEILDEQEYAPSMGARILSGKSSGMIAVVVGKRQEWEQESEKLEEILREIEKSLDEREYYMLLHFVKTAEEFVRYAAVWKLDGVICIWLNEEECTRIRQMCAVPVAAIYRTDRIYGKAGEEVARFLFKREERRIWFLDGTEEYGKVIRRESDKMGIFPKRARAILRSIPPIRKYFQKKAAVLKKNNIWKFQKTGICGECSIKSGWQGLLYPQICSYLHLPYREQRLSVICMIWKSRCRRKLK